MASALSRTCAAIRTLSGPKLTIRLSFSATDSIYLTRWLFNPMPEKALQMWGYGAIAGKGGMRLGAVLFSAAFLVMGAIQSAAGADLPVDLELVLAVDVSGSINTEYAFLQRSGYARALTDHRVVDAIQGGSFGRIALTYVEWADDSLQRTIVDWQVIDSPVSAKDFSRRLDGAPTVTEARTSISALI